MGKFKSPTILEYPKMGVPSFFLIGGLNKSINADFPVL
jgi:hypothetical protein